MTHRRAIVVDDVVPRAGWGAGYPRSAQIVQALSRCSDDVTLCPMMERSLPPAPAESFAGNVALSGDVGQLALRSALATRRGEPGLLWIGRPHNLAWVVGMHRTLPALFSKLRMVYDAEAVFACRDISALKLAGTPLSEVQSRRLLRKELQPAELAHAIVTVSAIEQKLVRDVIGRAAALIGLAAQPEPTTTPFAERRGLLFFGALWDEAAPNADSVRFFVERVLPRVAQRIDARLRIAGSGSDRAAWLAAIAGAGVDIEGPVADLAALFGQARVFVAPTRYGAGIPLKVVDAARHGVPVVATTLIAEQLRWQHGRELLVADDADAMAQACVDLHQDERLWERLRSAALDAVKRDFDPAAFDAAVAGVAWGQAPALAAPSSAPSP
ncbi:MAG TPA: glycosyltransferase family 4 protein [Casimicrobiaceae bacterium]|nr:glycosyltransferase family 4 protein [Casimicrobiaceae bacterium]